jgi:hypothetical protein
LPPSVISLEFLIGLLGVRPSVPAGTRRDRLPSTSDVPGPVLHRRSRSAPGLSMAESRLALRR